MIGGVTFGSYFQNVWLLEDRESPDEYRMIGLAILTVLGGLGAIGVGSILLARRLPKSAQKHAG